jgi:shikimate kinase
MILWLNGTFGAGKTTTATEIAAQLPGATLFDPEDIGFVLRALPAPTEDFQDLPPWRTLVIATAAELVRYTGGPVVVPMTLLREAYAIEIFDGLTARGVQVHHILLHADDEVLRRRIDEDALYPDDPARTVQARRWRLDHLATYRAALGWLTTAAHIIDTTEQEPKQVAARIIDQFGGAEPDASPVTPATPVPAPCAG